MPLPVYHIEKGTDLVLGDRGQRQGLLAWPFPLFSPIKQI